MTTLSTFKKISVFVFISLLACQSSWAEVLKWESKHLKFKATQGEDEKIVGLFKFTNVSDVPVNITDVKSSCGCTVPELEKRLYGPGESGEVSAVFTIATRVGLQRKNVTVSTDHPQEPKVDLILETNILEPIKVRPRFILWTEDKGVQTKSVTVNVATEDEIEVHAVELDGDLFTHEVEKVPGSKSFAIKVTPNAVDTSGRALLNLRLKNVTKDKLLAPVGVHLRVRASPKVIQNSQ